MLFHTQALADEEGLDSEEGQINWGEEGIYLGAAVYGETSRYVGLDGNTWVLPDVKARWGRYFIDGTHAGIGLFPWGRVIYEMGVNYGMSYVDVSETDSGSETFYEGLDDRDAAIEWFGSLTFYSDQGVGRLRYYTDVSGAYKGSRAVFSWERQIPGTGPFTITPAIVAQYHSAAFNRYYYGIPEDKARVNRPAYKPTNNGDFGINLLLGYRFDFNLGVYLDTRYTWLEEEASASPMTDNHFLIQSKLSIGYHF